MVYECPGLLVYQEEAVQAKARPGRLSADRKTKRQAMDEDNRESVPRFPVAPKDQVVKGVDLEQW